MLTYMPGGDEGLLGITEVSHQELKAPDRWTHAFSNNVDEDVVIKKLKVCPEAELS